MKFYLQSLVFLLTYVFASKIKTSAIYQSFTSFHELQGEWETQDESRVFVLENEVFFPNSDEAGFKLSLFEIEKMGKDNSFMIQLDGYICKIYTPSLIVWRDMQDSKNEITWQKPQVAIKEFTEFQGEWFNDDKTRKFTVFADVIMIIDLKKSKRSFVKLQKQDEEILFKFGFSWTFQNMDINEKENCVTMNWKSLTNTGDILEYRWIKDSKEWKFLQGEWIAEDRNETISVNGNKIKCREWNRHKIMTKEDELFIKNKNPKEIIWSLVDKEMKWIRPKISLEQLQGKWINSNGQHLEVKKIIDSTYSVTFLDYGNENDFKIFELKENDTQIIMNDEWILEKENLSIVWTRKKKHNKIESTKWFREEILQPFSTSQKNKNTIEDQEQLNSEEINLISDQLENSLNLETHQPISGTPTTTDTEEINLISHQLENSLNLEINQEEESKQFANEPTQNYSNNDTDLNPKISNSKKWNWKNEKKKKDSKKWNWKNEKKDKKKKK